MSRARAVGEAEPPAGHAVRLAEAVDDQHVLVELRRAGERLVVAERAVDLVADQQHVALAGQLGQVAQRLAAVDARRSGWPGC